MIYGCIAEKLTHSFSKEIHNRLFDYSYELKEVPQNELDSFMVSKDFKAINVTIPYKESVIPYLDWISDTAKKIGAVNTIVNENGFLKGYNTDFFGLTALINRYKIELKNKIINFRWVFAGGKFWFSTPEQEFPQLSISKLFFKEVNFL